MNNSYYLTGLPKELHVLDFGLFTVHANGRVIGICGFLIKTDAGENVLVDTGFPRRYALEAAAAARDDNLGVFGEVLVMTENNMPAEQLALSGTEVSDIDLLIMTHTHIDHVGGIADFAGAPILISSAERSLDRPLYFGTARPIEWPDREYRLLSEDTVIGPGFRVLHVPGHAPGQLALEIDLPHTGKVVVTGDAISRPSEVDEGFEGSWDVEQAKASGARLLKLARDTDAFLIYGHSPEQWPRLKKTPEFYS